MKNILRFTCAIILASTFAVGCTPQENAKKPAAQNTEAKQNIEEKAESTTEATAPAVERKPIVKRKFSPMDPLFKGNGISYGPYRKDQRPGGAEPTKEQIREDLKLLVSDNWEMLRMYGTEPFARKTCEVISEDKLNIKVLVGAWVATEKDQPEAAAGNQGQVDRAIKLANEFPEIVAAVSVGNESQGLDMQVLFVYFVPIFTIKVGEVGVQSCPDDATFRTSLKFGIAAPCSYTV